MSIGTKSHRSLEKQTLLKGKKGFLNDKNFLSESRVKINEKMRKDEIPSFATTWMDVENIMLSEISQTKKPRTT